MPLYEYQCDACNTRFERIQKFSDPPVDTCPACAGTVRKLLSSPAIQFKGTGWYITDYARKGSGDKGSDKGSTDKGSTDKSSAEKGSTEKGSAETGGRSSTPAGGATSDAASSASSATDSSKTSGGTSGSSA
ncbi:MAG: FmdB family zinc ribbon protein [Vicinamibacterales bacterium]